MLLQKMLFPLLNLLWFLIYPFNQYVKSNSVDFVKNFTSKHSTPLLNGPINKNFDQRSGILHIVRDP